MLITRPANISRYDFRRPNKLNREHVRALEIVGETFTRGLTTVLGTSLRAAVSTHLGDVGQVTYDEYVRELPSPTMLVVLEMPPLKGSAMFHLPRSLTMAIIERLLGGRGGSGSETPSRAPSEIEVRLLSRLLERAFDRLGKAFEALVPVRPVLTRIETNPQFAQLATPTEMIVVIDFEVSIDGETSSISLGIPFAMLAPVLDRATETSVADADLAASLESAIEARLGLAPLDVRVRFDQVNLTSRRIASLRPGDVIPLGQPLDEPMTVEVAGLPRFQATAGTKGKRVACLVTDTTSEVHTP